jgi:acetyltransferase-like isoleucine patch superfamily enzyme
MIELGERVTLGGSCSIMGHYAQGGFMVIAPTKIGSGATIGLRAIIMGGVQVGEKAKVMAGSFVLPKTVIPPGETWGGIPAIKIERQPERHES